jgi:hypothetical protein
MGSRNIWVWPLARDRGVTPKSFYILAVQDNWILWVLMHLHFYEEYLWPMHRICILTKDSTIYNFSITGKIAYTWFNMKLAPQNGIKLKFITAAYSMGTIFGDLWRIATIYIYNLLWCRYVYIILKHFGTLLLSTHVQSIVHKEQTWKI